MSQFVRNYGLEQIPQLPDDNGDLWTAFGVSYQPRWFLIRADGTTDRGGGIPPDNIIQDALTPD